MIDSGPIEEVLPLLVASGRFQAALALFRQSGQSEDALSPNTLSAAAQAATRVGEFDLAARLATAAREGFRAAGNLEGLLELDNLLGAVAFECGRIDQAEAYFQEAMELARQLDRRIFLARAANNLGNCAHLRGRAQFARDLYQQALETFDQVGDPRGIAETSHNLALCHRRAGHFAPAREQSELAVAAAERHGEKGLIALALLGRAELAIEEEVFREAVRDIDRAEVLAWSSGNEVQRLEASRLRALLALRQGNAPSAHHLAEALRSQAESSGCALIAAEAASIAALALKAGRRPEEADAARDAAISALKAIGAPELINHLHRDWQDD